MQVDFDLPNWAKSPQIKSEVELPRRGSHLEKSMWRHNFAAFLWYIGWNLDIANAQNGSINVPETKLSMEKLNSLQHKVAELKQQILQKW